MRTTFHLVAREAWEGQDPGTPYTHPTLESEGFIHCTDGEPALREVADHYYGEDRRPFVVLTVDLDRVGSPWRIDAPGTPYPHVYGPIPREAILEVRPMPRAPDGRFLEPGARP